MAFAAERPSLVVRDANRAFSALDYAGAYRAGRAPVIPSRWRAWTDVRGAGFDQGGGNALNGAQANVTAGLSYKVSADVVIGAYGGYEHFDYNFDTLSGNFRGNGGSIGAYAGWAISPTLRWKGMVGWTGLGYDSSAATASGSFTGSRWLFSTGLTGSYRFGDWVLEPSESIFVLAERQTGYTDSRGTVLDARSFDSGRVSLGGKVVAPGSITPIAGLRPYAGLYGDWGFMSDAVSTGVSWRSLGAGWAGRATAGVTMPVLAHGTLALGGEYGGIGGDYKVWTGKARLSDRF